MMILRELLAELVSRSGSDLHLKVGSPPTARINGELVVLGSEPLTPAEITRLVQPSMTEEHRERLARDKDVDFAVSIPGLARFRASLFQQRGTVVGVFRFIPFEVSSLASLHLPDACRSLAEISNGLVLVTGPTGSGKSTTLAAMIDHVNRTRRVHILTLEDPIEFIHGDKLSIVNQRQVGIDACSFGSGVIKALRHDPDIIMIGEMRDLETIEAALTAAETGHVVFGTLHTSSAVQTVERILDIFPGDKQSLIRFQMASTLRGILSQTLAPGVSGGRVPVVEVLIGTPAVRNLIREGKTHQLLSQMQSGRQQGMQTLEHALEEALRDGLITRETASGLRRED
jgi:twitching motility protein PilT